MEFSRDFLDYLKNARALKLRQGEADIGKTGAETGLLGAQAGRINTLTPFEARQMAAETGLTGAKTLAEYGQTAPARAAMSLTAAQAASQLAQAGATQSEAVYRYGGFAVPYAGTSGFFSPVQSGGSTSISGSGKPYTLASNYTAPSRDKLYATPSGGVTYMNPSLWQVSPPPPRKDINVGLGGRTYTANFASFGGYPTTGYYNQRSGGKNT